MTGFAVYSIISPTLAPRATSPGDEAFLDDLAERSFQFFWEQSDPHTGLARERASFSRPQDEDRNVGRTATTGFGLAALCIGAARDWIDAGQARSRVRSTLEYFAHRAPNERGWFYRRMDIRTGQRDGFRAIGRDRSEISSIDSAFLMGGI